MATAADLEPLAAEALAQGGTRLLVARTDRQRNVEVHAELNDAVGCALHTS